MGRLSVAALLTALVPATVFGAPVALLQNGRFTATSGGMPVGWRLEAWARDLTDVGWEPGTDGGGLVRIVNRGPNDARICQTMSVTPGAEYRVTARVKTENVGTATAGALIALEPRIADSIDVKGTQGWQTISVTATAQEQTSWDVCLRLGSYANLNTGTAWFSDVQVEPIGGTPVDTGGHWPTLSLAPLLDAFRRTPWVQSALPLLGGLLLAFGLGIVRRPR